jgi:hypothetical protein
VSILWHWASDVWLRVLIGSSLDMSPVVVDMTGESGVWMRILWHWTSDIGLWVLISLNVSPVVVNVAGEG